MTVEEKAYNYASKVVKNRLTASEVAAHYGRGYIDGQEDMKQLGWHPSSKPPKDGEEVIAAGDYSTTRAVFHEGKYYIAEYYHNPESLNCALNGVKWWCYPPEED